LGDLYRKLKRFEAAEKALRRALTIRQRTKGENHKSVGQSLHSLGNLYRDTERPAKAEKLYPQGIRIKEKALGSDHPSVGRAIADFGKLRLRQGKNDEAETLFKRALQVQEKALGPEHANVASTLVNLATAQSGLKRPAEAEALFRRALAIREKVFGPKHPSVASTLDHLSVLTHDKGNSAEALELIRRATSIRRSRVADAAATKSAARTTGRRFGKKAFHSHLRILSEAMAAGLVDKDAGAGEGFEVAQFASSSGAAKAVAKMAARFAAGDDDLAKSVRANQDAIDRWQALDKQLLAAVSSPPEERNAEAEARWRQERDKLESLIAETDAVLAEKFPEYAAMANPKPLSLPDVRDLLGDNEAFLVYAVAKRQSYLWVIRRRRAAMFALPVAAEDLDDAVASLRADMDPTGIQKLKDIPQFPTTEAHALYRQLFAPAEELLKGATHVFVIPDRALQSLPLGVLVTGAPERPVADFSGYQGVPWLARRYALTVLPSVSSLSALRRFAARAEAGKPFAGFGDPDLKDGSESGLPPLPQTAGELKAMAKSLGAGEESIYLRGRATETAVKATDLSDTRVLAFATHGLMAGEFEGVNEPALVMTPPARATETDDGLLTAGEVAQLKLNAEWVILSACNTAAADGTPGAEGLSGLAKAFFYAGSRTLLVSHWLVESEAAVKLTTRMFREAKGGKVGRAEALRRSMLTLIGDKEKSYYAHPMFWASFMVVGEGGTGAAANRSRSP
jgi:CHAT domain-containing protein